MLGGRCVDGGDLGRGALTPFVNTFLAVAGPNQGIPFCATVRGTTSSPTDSTVIPPKPIVQEFLCSLTYCIYKFFFL